MIDQRRIAVLIRTPSTGPFVDRTAEVKSYRTDATTVKVTFEKGTYSYGRQRAVVMDNPEPISLGTETMIAVDGEIWATAIEAYHFAGPDRGWWHIFYADGEKCSARSDDRVRVLHNGAADPRAADILRYWRAVAAKLPDESSSLRDGYNRLAFVHPDSALHHFLEARPIHAREPASSTPIYPFRTNLSQRAAIDNALRYPISVIDGPPGTGKTQTILNLIANIIVDESKTVAIVSSNNTAVDNVRDKLTDEGFGYVAANLGKREKKTRFFADQQQRNQLVNELRCSTEQALPSAEDMIGRDRRLQGLQDAERRLAQLRAKLDAYELERRHFLGYFERQQLPDPEQLPVLRWNSKKILDFIADTDLATAHAGRITQLIDRIGNYFKYRSMRRIDPQDVDIVLRLQRLFYDRKITELEQQIDEVQKSLDGADFDRLAEEQRTLSALRLRAHLRQRYLQRPPQIYDQQYTKKKWAEFSHDYPIVLSTCHSLEHSIGRGRLVDYLVIDEASQVDLLAAGIALACCRNLIVVGDLRQLAHIPGIQESECPPAPGSTYDYRRHSILSSLIELYGESLPRVMLREHYRCDPKIIGFCNQKFYGDDLIPFTQSAPESRTMVVARTVAGNHMRQHLGGGRSNQREVDVIEREVIPQLCADIPSENIGVTTPYRKQVSKVTDALIESVEADTVHSFQGREKDAIVMTTVLDETWRGRTGLRFADDPRLVNVAVSRAKKLFVLVTNHAMLPTSRHLRDLIGYINYHNLDAEVFDSSVVSVFDLLYQDYSDRLRPFAARLRRESKYLSEDIIRTVLEELMQQDDYRELSFIQQMLVKNLLPDTDRLTPEQLKYVKHRSSIDFVVFNRITKRLLCAIEVDGFAFHENSPTQLARDALKNGICESYEIPLVRLPTTGSDEIERLRRTLDSLIYDQVVPSRAL